MKQITKLQARMRWVADEDFWMVPCNMSFDSGFCMHIVPNLVKPHQTSFDRLLDNFTYYNCDAERGYCTHFYVTD